MMVVCYLALALRLVPDVNVQLVERPSGSYWVGRRKGEVSDLWSFPRGNGLAWASKSPDGKTFALPVPGISALCVGVDGRARWRLHLEDTADPTSLVALSSYVVIGTGFVTETGASLKQLDEWFRVRVVDADFGTELWSEPLRIIGRPVAAVADDAFVSVYFEKGVAKRVAVWNAPFKRLVKAWNCDAATSKALGILYEGNDLPVRARFTNDGQLVMTIYPSRSSSRGRRVTFGP